MSPRLLLPALALALSGCTHLEEIQERRITAAATSGVCNVHRAPMARTAVPIAYGFIINPPRSTGSVSAQYFLFPFIAQSPFGGCNLDFEHPTADIWVCAGCERSKQSWIADHPGDLWAANQLQHQLRQAYGK